MSIEIRRMDGTVALRRDGIDLRGADLRGADLHAADLSHADLRGANLYGANLYGAALRGTDLSHADLRGADLRGANLRGANLYAADLRSAALDAVAAARLSICPAGDLIVWKKCREGVLVKLLIPAAAARSNATGRKCRAEFARVLEVVGRARAVSVYDPKVTYSAGDDIRPDSWDPDRWAECSHGIHFYLTRAEAEAQV